MSLQLLVGKGSLTHGLFIFPLGMEIMLLKPESRFRDFLELL